MSSWHRQEIQPYRPRVGRDLILSRNEWWGWAWRAAERTVGGTCWSASGRTSLPARLQSGGDQTPLGRIKLRNQSPLQRRGKQASFSRCATLFVVEGPCRWLALCHISFPAHFKAYVLTFSNSGGSLGEASCLLRERTRHLHLRAKSGRHPEWAGCATSSWGHVVASFQEVGKRKLESLEDFCLMWVDSRSYHRGSCNEQSSDYETGWTGAGSHFMSAQLKLPPERVEEDCR